MRGCERAGWFCLPHPSTDAAHTHLPFINIIIKVDLGNVGLYCDNMSDLGRHSFRFKNLT